MRMDKQVMHNVSSFSYISVIQGMSHSQVSITAEPVSWSYLAIRVSKTKDAAAVSLR